MISHPLSPGGRSGMLSMLRIFPISRVSQLDSGLAGVLTTILMSMEWNI